MTKMRNAAAFCVLLAASAASAQYSAGGIKVGLLTDMNGVYSAISGPGSLKAAEMAADDFMKANKDFAGKVTVIAVDHQNKADIASNKASASGSCKPAKSRWTSRQRSSASVFWTTSWERPDL